MLPRYTCTSTHWSGLLCHACHAALLATTDWYWVWTPNCDFTKHVFFRFCYTVPTPWTPLANDICRLQSFHMGCQRKILGVRWQDHVKNVDIRVAVADTNWPAEHYWHSRQETSCTVWAHIVRLDSSVPAHQALKQVIAMKAGRCSGMNWRRLPGRPRKTWIQQIGDGTTTSWKQMWHSAEEHGHRGEP